MAAKMLQRLVGSSVDEGPSFQPEQKSEPTPVHSVTHVPADQPVPKLDLEGAQLFELFIHDQLNNNKVTSRGLKDLIIKPASYTLEVCETATKLCNMAVTFAESEDRQKVKDAAMTVSSDMMRQELTTVLQSMLSESPGLDEGVLVLFYFCLDLSVRLLETEHREAWEVITWCKQAIDTALGPYVLTKGGWLAVGSSAVQAMSFGMSLVGVVKRLVSM